MLSTRIDDIVFTGLFNVWKTGSYISFHQRQCHLQERCIEPRSFCLCIYVALKSFEDVESKGFIVRLSIERVGPSSRGVCLLSVVCRSDRRARESAWGDTPLHLAVFRGQVKAAEFLLSKGVGVDTKNNDGLGPPVGTRVRNAVSNLGYPQKMLGSVLTGNMSIKYRVNLETRWFFFAFKAAAQRIWIRIECPSPVLDAKFSSGMAWAPSFDQLILLHKAFIRVWSSWGQQRKPESKFGFSLWRSRKVPFREWRETQVQSQTGFQ